MQGFKTAPHPLSHSGIRSGWWKFGWRHTRATGIGAGGEDAVQTSRWQGLSMVCTSKPHHTGQPALPIGSSGAPIILLCNTEIKQLLVSSSMDYNKYYNFVPNILGLSSNYLTLYKFFNLSEVKFLQLQICPGAMAVERG